MHMHWYLPNMNPPTHPHIPTKRNKRKGGGRGGEEREGQGRNGGRGRGKMGMDLYREASSSRQWSFNNHRLKITHSAYNNRMASQRNRSHVWENDNLLSLYERTPSFTPPLCPVNKHPLPSCTFSLHLPFQGGRSDLLDSLPVDCAMVPFVF